jgi:DNA-binding PadR family transcriptional regulator
MSNQQIKGHLEAMVLAILEEGPAHGYSIIESLRKNSSGLFDLPEGTVYPALHRLEEGGLVKSTRELVDGRERRVYQIVTAGQSTLKESRAAWQAFSSAVSRILVVNP